MGYKVHLPQPVTESGTGVTTMTTAYAPVCAGTTATGALQVASTGIGTSGFILTSNGSSALPSFQAAPAGGITTVDGDSGSVTGSTVTLTGGTSGAVFTGSGTTMTESFSYLSLPSTTATNGQVRINGSPALWEPGTNNIFVGSAAGNSTVSGINNSGCGVDCLPAVTSGAGNCALGTSALFSLAGGSNNIALGVSSAAAITSGSYNVSVGDLSAGNYTGSESSNICINSSGTASESNVCRLGAGTGTSAQQLNKTFISGIRGITPGNSDIQVAMIDTNGQLGTNGVYMSATGSSTNIFGGYLSGNASVSGVNNTSLGYNSLHALGSGQSNVAIGLNALAATVSDIDNTAVGTGSLAVYNASGQGYNTAVGFNTLSSLATGIYNTSIGTNAVSAYTGAESWNISIGTVAVAAESFTLRIGTTTGSSVNGLVAAYICGIQGIGVTGAPVLVSSSNQLGVAVSSARSKDNIQDMGDFSSPMMTLTPRTFTYKEGEDLSVQPGLIAEEVAAIMPSMVVYDASGLPLTVKYHEMQTMLLNELQKALKRIEALEARG